MEAKYFLFKGVEMNTMVQIKDVAQIAGIYKEDIQ